MEPEVLVFMPNGDITLTLTRHVYEAEDDQPIRTFPPRKKRRLSVVQQTPIDENKKWELEDRELEDVLEDESMLFYAPDAPGASEGPSHPPTPRGRGSDASSRRDRSSSPPASFWAQLKRQQAARNETAVEDDEVLAEPESGNGSKNVVSSSEVHCIVSSKHMILASPVFGKLLASDSAEAKLFRAKGHAKIRVLADFDIMVILLNVIHGSSRKVPRQVTLDELSSIAQLASKFGMTEAVQFFSDTWIDALEREGFPRTYNRAVLQLLLIFHIFDRPEEFKTMTRLIQRECDENVVADAGDIPLPHNLLDAIRKEREEAIDSAITTIHDLITRYLDGKTICDASLDEDMQYACDAMILGSLLKSARKIDIWPKPEAPFNGRKFKDLAKAIKAIRIVDVCNRTSRRFANLGSAGNGHGLEDEIAASIKRIEAGIDGLELLQYTKKSEDLDAGLEMFVLNAETDDEARSIGSEETITELQVENKLDSIRDSPRDASEINTLTTIGNAQQDRMQAHHVEDPLISPSPGSPKSATDQFRIQSPMENRDEHDDSEDELLYGVRRRDRPSQVTPRATKLPQGPSQQDHAVKSNTYTTPEPQQKQTDRQESFSPSRSSPSQLWMQSDHATRKQSLESASSWETAGARTPTDAYGMSDDTKHDDSASSVESHELDRPKSFSRPLPQQRVEPRPLSEMIFKGEQLYGRSQQPRNEHAAQSHALNLESIPLHTDNRATYAQSQAQKPAIRSDDRKSEAISRPTPGTTQIPPPRSPERSRLSPKHFDNRTSTIVRPTTNTANTADRHPVATKGEYSAGQGPPGQDPVIPREGSTRRERIETKEQARQDLVAKAPEPRSQQQPRQVALAEQPSQLTQSEKLSQAVSQLEAARAYIQRQTNPNPPPQPEPLRREPRPTNAPRRSPPAPILEQDTSKSAANNRPLQQANSSPHLHRNHSNGSQVPYVSSKLSQSEVIDDDDGVEDTRSLDGKTTRVFDAAHTSQRPLYISGRPPVSSDTAQMRRDVPMEMSATSMANGKTSPVERFRQSPPQQTSPAQSRQQSAKTEEKASFERDGHHDTMPAAWIASFHQNKTSDQQALSDGNISGRAQVPTRQDHRPSRIESNRAAVNDTAPRLSETAHQARQPQVEIARQALAQEEYKNSVPVRPAPQAEQIQHVSRLENMPDASSRVLQQPPSSMYDRSSPSASAISQQTRQTGPPREASTAQVFNSSPSSPPMRTSQTTSTSYISNNRYEAQQPSQYQQQYRKQDQPSSQEHLRQSPPTQSPYSPRLSQQLPTKSSPSPLSSIETLQGREAESINTKASDIASTKPAMINFGRREVESPEDEDEGWEGVHKFNMRKSKKKFSMRI